MVAFLARPVDDTDAHALLTEYFDIRIGGFPGGGYRRVFPAAGSFVPPDGVFLVAYEGEDAVGCGAIRRLPDGPAGARFEIKHLYVRETGRGRGWGRELLAELERRAAAAGAREVVLDTHHTLTAAGQLYERTGYERIEPYNDNPNATRWYRKLLGVADADGEH